MQRDQVEQSNRAFWQEWDKSNGVAGAPILAEAKAQVALIRRQSADTDLTAVEKTAKLSHELKEAVHAKEEAEARLKQQTESLTTRLEQAKEDAAAIMASKAQEGLGRKGIGLIADRGYYKGTEILEAEKAGVRMGLWGAAQAIAFGLGGLVALRYALCACRQPVAVAQLGPAGYALSGFGANDVCAL